MKLQVPHDCKVDFPTVSATVAVVESGLNFQLADYRYSIATVSYKSL